MHFYGKTLLYVGTRYCKIWPKNLIDVILAIYPKRYLIKLESNKFLKKKAIEHMSGFLYLNGTYNCGVWHHHMCCLKKCQA